MKLENVWIVFRKEFLDVIRDRRTILSMILLPILIFPFLTIGMGSFFAGQMEKMGRRSSPVVILDSQKALQLVGYLQETSGLQIITSISDSSVALEMLRDHTIQAILLVPDGLQGSLDSGNGRGRSPEIQIWCDKSYIESDLVEEKIRRELTDFRDSLVQRQLMDRGLPYSLVEPFSIMTANRASQSQMASAVMGMFLPYLVILLALTGSTYPAIDLTAGEKERGTMETLLVSPASRLELVLGKVMTTMLAGIITAFLAVISLTVTFYSGGALFTVQAGADVQFTFDPLAFGMIFLLLFPLTALFASVLVAIAVNARSYKEAQSYVYPLIILMIIPAIASMMPGFEADIRTAFMPVVNVSLVLRNALMGIYDFNLILMTFISSLTYAAAAVFVAVRIFQRESVLLRV